MPYGLTYKWYLVNNNNNKKKQMSKIEPETWKQGTDWKWLEGSGEAVTGERKGRVRSRNMYKGPTGMDNRVGIDSGGGEWSSGEQWVKRWGNCNWKTILKNVSQNLFPVPVAPPHWVQWCHVAMQARGQCGQASSWDFVEKWKKGWNRG